MIWLLVGCLASGPTDLEVAQQAELVRLNERVAALETENASLREELTRAERTVERLEATPPVVVPEADWVGEGVILRERIPPFEELAGIARVVPYYQDGVLAGYRVSGIRRHSALDKLDIRNGDVVTAINGTSLDSLEAAMGLAGALESSDVLVVEMLRRGEPVTLRISIR